MRCWHYTLAPYLPKSQLLSQYRELVCIAKNIHDTGTPNHILVNPILDYPRQDFNIFCNIVIKAMRDRGYKVSDASIHKLENYVDFELDSEQAKMKCFEGWHDMEYVGICRWNLYEKKIRGQKDFSDDVWAGIVKAYEKYRIDEVYELGRKVV